MLTTNLITADDLKELIISTMVEYLKNNSVTLGGGARVTGNLTVDNEIRANYVEALNKVGVRDNTEGGEVILYGLNDTKITCHIDVVPDNRMRLWAEVPATDTTPKTTYEVAYWDLTKKATKASNV